MSGTAVGRRKRLLDLVDLADAWADGPIPLPDVERLIGCGSRRAVERAVAPLREAARALGPFDVRVEAGTLVLDGRATKLLDAARRVTDANRTPPEKVAQSLARARALQAVGLCIVCKASTGGKARCPGCAARQARVERARRDRYAREGRCGECGTWTGGPRCAGCRARAAATKSTIRARRIALGRCGRCGEPGPNPCDPCRAKQADYDARKAARGERDGKCVKCGSRPRVDACKVCARCRETRRRASARYYDKKRRAG